MFFPVLWLISCFSVARGELQAVCSSGMTVLENQTASPGVMKITGTLPYDRNLQRSCVLKMDLRAVCMWKLKEMGTLKVCYHINVCTYHSSSNAVLIASERKPFYVCVYLRPSDQQVTRAVKSWSRGNSTFVHSERTFGNDFVRNCTATNGVFHTVTK